MPDLKVTLFGKFKIECAQQAVNAIQARKVQELFIYLLMFRNHPHSREMLSELLWGDQPPTKSKKNLRQTLWRLQAILKEIEAFPALELLADNEWIQINTSAHFWLDTCEVEKTFKWANSVRACDLSIDNFQTIQRAVELYQGDLLEGWYQDWCILERERFQTMYLTLLDKLVQCCEIQSNYDVGLSYGAEILRHDRAYERTHQQMMRLYYLAGDRTQALHQYRRCVAALRDELDIEPSQHTKQIYEQIRSDTLDISSLAPTKGNPSAEPGPPALSDVIQRLDQFSETLNRIEHQVQQRPTRT